MKQNFTKFLKEIYCLSSDWHFSFKCFQKMLLWGKYFQNRHASFGRSECKRFKQNHPVLMVLINNIRVVLIKKIKAPLTQWCSQQPNIAWQLHVISHDLFSTIVLWTSMGRGLMWMNYLHSWSTVIPYSRHISILFFLYLQACGNLQVESLTAIGLLKQEKKMQSMTLFGAEKEKEKSHGMPSL